MYQVSGLAHNSGFCLQTQAVHAASPAGQVMLKGREQVSQYTSCLASDQRLLAMFTWLESVLVALPPRHDSRVTCLVGICPGFRGQRSDSSLQATTKERSTGGCDFVH
jgi:hypothetical protein